MASQPADPDTVVFTAERLIVRQATVSDAAMFYALWNDPAVMTHVGFPHGLGITLAEIEESLHQQPGDVFHRLLVVALRATGEVIGECYMTRPTAAGVSTTDVKLLPGFWGYKYGVEIKKGLLLYLFAHTDCTVVKATPNVNNIASIKMQEAVGAIRAGTGKSLIPQDGLSHSVMVEYYTYRVYRRIWQKAQHEAERAAKDVS